MQGSIDESPVKAFFKSKWVKIVLLLDLLVFVILIIFAVIKFAKNATIVFSIAPTDAIISLNGNTSYHNGSYPINPGHYDVQISRDGLVSKTFSLDVKANSTVTLTAFLTDSNKSFDFYIQRDNSDSMQKLQEIASSDSNTTTDNDTSAEEFIEKYNYRVALLSTALPINYNEYQSNANTPTGQEIKLSINLRNGNAAECKTTLCIDALMVLTDDKELVKKLLREKGINSDEYEIVYTKY